MRGRITRVKSFQDWWGSDIGKEVEIVGESATDFFIDEKNPFNSSVHLAISKDCIEIIDDHPNLSHISTSTLLEELKRRGVTM